MAKTLICRMCGKETPFRGPHQKYCPECAVESKKESHRQSEERKRLKKALKKDAEPAAGDTPEMIQICLSCTKKKCNDCLKEYRKRGNNDDRRESFGKDKKSARRK